MRKKGIQVTGHRRTLLLTKEMDATAEPVLQAVTERLVPRFQPLAVILFGSRARGDARPDSDFDLVVVLPGEAGIDESVDVQSALDGLPGERDVIVVSKEQFARSAGSLGSVLRPALREGRLLYLRKGVKLEVADVNPVEEASEWLRSARADLRAADASLADTEFLPRHACYYAQQTAEKAFKAALIFLGQEPPRTHNLNDLRDLLPAQWAARGRYPDLKNLGEWIFRGRYPNRGPEPSAEDAREAVAQARGLLESLVTDLHAAGLPPLA